MKELPKPISQALKRSKLSQELSADFPINMLEKIRILEVSA